MTEQELLDWAWHTVDGNTYHEMKILKIALCESYQKKYSDIETMCRKAGLAPAQADDVRKWKYHNKDLDSYIFYTLYDYLVFQERERYLKALYHYNKQYYLP